MYIDLFIYFERQKIKSNLHLLKEWDLASFGISKFKLSVNNKSADCKILRALKCLNRLGNFEPNAIFVSLQLYNCFRESKLAHKLLNKL